MSVGEWLLSATERGNPHTRIDAGRLDGAAWSEGNEVRPLVHGARYFAHLYAALTATGAGDRVYFADWRGDPDERLTDDPRSAISEVLSAAARRGVEVRGLLWRSHWRGFGFHSERSRAFGLEIDEAGGQCLRDMRVRTGGSHHQKLVVVRYAGDAGRDVAFVGGIDLCHSRRDDADHGGDPQPLPIAAAYGPTPAWHDVQVAIRGPAVHDVETTFRERWEDSTPLTLNPGRGLSSLLQREDLTPAPLGEQWPPPPVLVGGHEIVQVLRTYPAIQPRGYDFAPDGERSIVLGNAKALARARRLVYVEDQYLWSEEVGRHFATALRENSGLRMVLVLPIVPDEDGAVTEPPQWWGRRLALAPILEAGGERVAVYGLTNAAGLPIYVHSKVCIIDDRWASVGSDNFNRRSWTSDTEAACAVVDDRATDASPVPDDAFARRLRRTLVAEHLGCAEDEVPDGPAELCAAMAGAAAALDAWYAAGGPAAPGRPGTRWARTRLARTRNRWTRRRAADRAGRLLDRAAAEGIRPPGQLRRLDLPDLTGVQRWWAPRLYASVFDPDGTVASEPGLDLEATSAS